MRRVALFVEDAAHEVFLNALLRRLAREHSVEVRVVPYSASGGLGRALRELKHFVNDLERGRVGWPDLLVVGLDANCHTYSVRRRQIEAALGHKAPTAVCAVPDPHVERWLLVDSAAFKAVVGRGCAAPDHRCERGRYKRQLIDAVRKAGLVPLLGGLEHTEDIVEAMDLTRVGISDASLGRALGDLRAVFNGWVSSDDRPDPRALGS